MEIKTPANWNNFRTLFKSALVGALILLLLIPTFFIQNLVSERQGRQQEAVSEISSRWAASQTFTGPVIGIPYYDSVADNGNRQRVKHWAYFLPDKLEIHSKMVPEKRYRGIYEVIVYTAEMDVRGNFGDLNLDKLGLSPTEMLWKEATVFVDISDVQGLNEDVALHVRSAPTGDSASILLAPGRTTTEQFGNALSAPLAGWIGNLASKATIGGAGSLDFSTSIRMKGSGNLLFVPVGRETQVYAASSWPDPSFTGSVLPTVRTVQNNGFVADWKVLAMHRKFPQQWKEGLYELATAGFGVGLIVPVDAYQQTTRSVKYAILIILLTFTAFLLIEWIYNLPMGTLQYVLVGFALCIFYTLLLSLSEYLGFNAAYGLASVATIGLIGWYVGVILRSRKVALFITFLLVVQYGFVFVLIQLQDYALLMGSLGLFVTLAIVMQASRKIKWQTA
jgi:inner membrane protein